MVILSVIIISLIKVFFFRDIDYLALLILIIPIRVYFADSVKILFNSKRLKEIIVSQKKIYSVDEILGSVLIWLIYLSSSTNIFESLIITIIIFTLFRTFIIGLNRLIFSFPRGIEKEDILHQKN